MRLGHSLPALALAAITLVLTAAAPAQEALQAPIDVTEEVFGHPWGMSTEDFLRKHNLVDEEIPNLRPSQDSGWYKIGVDDHYGSYNFKDTIRNMVQDTEFSFLHDRLYQVRISVTQDLIEPVDMEAFDPYRKMLADKAAKQYWADGAITIKGFPAGHFEDGKYKRMEIQVEVTNTGLEKQIKQAHKADPQSVAEALEAAIMPVIVLEPAFPSDED